jgi:adenylosuccinate synthase
MLGEDNPDIVCSSFGPNAGHTYVDNDGNATVLKALPSSSITARNAMVLIMPDSVINIDTFLKEAALVGENRVFVHPRVAVVTPDDAAAASLTGRHVAGTMQGTGHAIARKILRLKDTKLAMNLLPSRFIMDTCEAVRTYVNKGATVLFEMSQGFDLSINHGFDYPYLTSRDITVGAAINSMGIPHKQVSQVIGCIRTYPIRVGNVDGGWSGPCWPDQAELSWQAITTDSGSATPILEHTTVTKRVRRVFTFSPMQVAQFVAANQPDWLFLNFMQYVNAADAGKSHYSALSAQSKSFVEFVENTSQTRVALIGTGAKNNEVIRR